jgi:hypothetical protein
VGLLRSHVALHNIGALTRFQEKNGAVHKIISAAARAEYVC